MRFHALLLAFAVLWFVASAVQIEVAPREISLFPGVISEAQLRSSYELKANPVNLPKDFVGWFKFALPSSVSTSSIKSVSFKAAVRASDLATTFRWSLHRFSGESSEHVLATLPATSLFWEEFRSPEVKFTNDLVDAADNTLVVFLQTAGGDSGARLASLTLVISQHDPVAFRSVSFGSQSQQSSVLMNMIRAEAASASCVPDCTNKECGFDGCNGWCGANNCGAGRGCQNGKCVVNLGLCGDGYCGEGERCETCPQDCPCVVNCGNGICDSGEKNSTCPQDCLRDNGVCGDGKCESNQWAVEDKYRCCRDCGGCDVCGDGVCGTSEGCHDCPSDCGACAVTCGDGQCNGAETCATCTRDCGYCSATAGNGKCEFPEEKCDVSADCGACPVITSKLLWEGVEFATLDNADPYSTASIDDTCPYAGSYIPAGWCLAQWTPSAQAMIATGMHRWNTNCIVFGDGRALDTNNGSACASAEVYLNTTRGKASLFPDKCGSKILIQKGSLSCPDNCINAEHGTCDVTTGRCSCAGRWTGYNCNRTLGDLTVPDHSTKTWWKPTVRTRWQWQLQGEIDMSFDVPVYDIDFGYPASVIGQLHALGRKVICYWSAGSSEVWRSDFGLFPAEVQGGVLKFGTGDVFNDEKWLDIRRLDIIGPIMLDRIDESLLKGCDAIEYDNPDGFYHDAGFAKPFTYEQQLEFNRWLAGQAHARGMGAILKNDIMQVWELRDTFDGAVNEQCWEDDECYMWWTMVDAGKPLFQTEYEVERCYYCERANQMGTSTIKKHPDLTACRMDCSTPWNQTHCDMYRTTGDKCWVRQCEPANECPTDATQDPICGSTTLAC
eukprot:TRINITY_DN2778_c0_g2_i1.p1 TRINITY_DN2778_c0_g2~~TRINITY_DN2778_c0_g2_i1.p1  ORF type:complete len:838 (-),score=151.67 TRINITY_DN2778_c0_g2_i1:242-2755(-)